jgi:hypothetical protein
VIRVTDRISVTDLELDTLVCVEDGVDPWKSYGGSTRRVSQTLGRLQRKGLISEVAGTYAPTRAGRDVLTKERGVGGRLK